MPALTRRRYPERADSWRPDFSGFESGAEQTLFYSM
jgi:hypothetical protein